MTNPAKQLRTCTCDECEEQRRRAMRPDFPRQLAEVNGRMYKAASAERMARWVVAAIDAEGAILKPLVSDDGAMQRLRRMTAWRVLVTLAERETGRVQLTLEELSLMATIARTLMAQRERECVDDVADRLVDQSANHEASGYMVGPFAVQVAR